MTTLLKTNAPRKPRRHHEEFESLGDILPSALAVITYHRCTAERWTRQRFTLARSLHLDRLCEAERALRELLAAAEGRP